MAKQNVAAVRRVVTASLIGATIEWYDFFLYGVVAGIVFNKLYFPTDDPLVSTMLAYTTFGVGFITRPLGGLIFGHFGDRIGRKSMLVMTLMIMGVSTFLIGLVPTYDSIGIWAPVLLLLLRVFQGIGLGGEWGGAVLMAYEYAPPEKKGFYASLPQIGLAIGLCLASGTVALLSTLLTDAQFMAWGWRVAFLASAAMVLVGMYIRLNIKETPEFSEVKARNAESRIPFFDMLRRYPGNVLKGMGARYIDGVFFNVFGVFSISYLTQTVQITRTQALTGVMAAALVMCVFIPFFGRLSDRIGRTRVYFWGSLITAAASLSGLLADAQQPGQRDAGVAGHHRALRHLLRRRLRAGGRAVLRAVRRQGALHRHLLRLSVLRHLRLGHHAHHRHRPAQERRRPAWLICLYVLFAGLVSALCAWLIGRGGVRCGDRPAVERIVGIVVAVGGSVTRRDNRPPASRPRA